MKTQHELEMNKDKDFVEIIFMNYDCKSHPAVIKKIVDKYTHTCL